MAFHRLTANPGGYDPLPVGYDFINDPAANGDAGVPANADGKKVGGPNAGTYFVGFGEDATSSFANRGMKALAQNTDFLDEAIRRPLAIPARTANATAGAPVGSILLPDSSGVFVGAAVSAIPETYQTLFAVLDDKDNEIIDVATGSPVVVTSITGVPAVALGDGFSPGTVTLNLSPSIPTGVTYRVYYAKKGNLLTMPSDTFTVIKIRGAQELPAGFEDFQNQISRWVSTNVVALVGTLFETPNGSRLAKSNAMGFDVDADGTVGGTHRFFWRKLRDVGGALTMLEVNDDTTLGGVSAGRIRMFSGAVLEAVGTMLLRDANIASGAAQGGAFIPLTGATAANGDKYIRLMEQGPLVGSTTRSVFQMINGRWACTVGDGSASFGDFNGADAIQQAVNYWNVTLGAPISGLLIQVKQGQYTSTDVNGQIAIPDSSEVTIEGPGSLLATLTLSRTATSGLFADSNSVLRVKGMTITRSGTFAPSITASGNIIYEDCQLINVQTKCLNQGTFGGDPFVPGAFSARRCTFNTVSTTKPSVLINRDSASVLETVYYAFDDCVFLVNETNTSPIRVEAAAASGNDAVINSIRLSRCRVLLGSSTVSGNNPVGNSGIIDFVDNGSVYGTVSGGVLIRDILLEDCDVWAGGQKRSDATVQLLHFRAPGMAVKRLRIRAGRWMVMKDSPSLAPLALAGSATLSTDGAPQEIDIDGTVFGWAEVGDFSGDGRTTQTTYGRMYANLTPPASTADHAAFYLNALRVRVNNIRMVGVTHYSDNAELWVDGAKEIEVDGVKLETGAVGVAGTAPNFRVKMTPSSNNLADTTEANRFVRHISIPASRIDGANGQGALVVLPFGYLLVAENFISNTAGGPSTSGGIQLPLVDGAYGVTTIFMLEGLKLHKNRMTSNSAHGFSFHHDGVAGRTSLVGRLEITDNVASLNSGRGIHVECIAGATATCSFPHMIFRGNTCNTNTGRAWAIFPSAFPAASGIHGPIVVGNQATCTSNTDAPAIGSLQAAGDQIAFTLQGNSVYNTTGGFGVIGIRLLNGTAFPTDDNAGGFFLRCAGVETGWVVITGTVYRAYANGNVTLMTQNGACSVRLT